MTVNTRWWTDGEKYYDALAQPISLDEDGTATAWDEDDLFAVAFFLRPARCSVCERSIDEDAKRPLCSRCEDTARATARYFPEGPEAFASWERLTDDDEPWKS